MSNQNYDNWKLQTPPEGKEIGLCLIHNHWLNDDGECSKCETAKELNDIRLFDMIIAMWHKSIALFELAEKTKDDKAIAKYRAIRNYLSDKIDHYEPQN